MKKLITMAFFRTILYLGAFSLVPNVYKLCVEYLQMKCNTLPPFILKFKSSLLSSMYFCMKHNLSAFRPFDVNICDIKGTPSLIIFANINFLILSIFLFVY